MKEKEESIKTLIEAVHLANKKGAFDLKESAIIYNAVMILSHEEKKEEKESK